MPVMVTLENGNLLLFFILFWHKIFELLLSFLRIFLVNESTSSESSAPMQVMRFFENCWFEDIGKIYFYPKGKKKRLHQMQKWSSFERFITNVKIIYLFL